MRIRSLTIEYLRECNLSCKHCAVNASPGVSDRVSLAEAKKWIASAREYSAEDIYISGGEPFLAFDELCELAKFSHSLGLRFTTYSNAFWALNTNEVKKYLLPLYENGLTSLHLSLDCFHIQEGIPLKNLLNIASVAKNLGLKIILKVVEGKHKKMSHSFIKEISKKYDVHIERDFIRPVGRANGLNGMAFVKEKKNCLKGGCRSYGNPLISSKGEVFACGGAYLFSNTNNPLRLGNAYTMSFLQIIEKFYSLKLLNFIATFGIFSVYQLINKDKNIPFGPGTYVCDFCNRILNSEDNVRLVQKKMENPDPDLRFKIEIAEISCKNIEKIKTSTLKSRLIKAGNDTLQLFWISLRNAVAFISDLGRVGTKKD